MITIKFHCKSPSLHAAGNIATPIAGIQSGIKNETAVTVL